MLATHNANAARARGGAAETIRKCKHRKFNRSANEFQEYTAWLSQTAHWRDSLAARIADARSRVTVGLHINELHSIQEEVAAFKVHCLQRPSFTGGTA